MDEVVESGWNLWMWLVGIVSRRQVWQVGVCKSMGIPYSRKIWRELYLAIWPPTAEIKYWKNLNLAICDCEAKFHYVFLACR